jgi:hypothetical protein
VFDCGIAAEANRRIMTSGTNVKILLTTLLSKNASETQLSATGWLSATRIRTQREQRGQRQAPE